MEVLIYGLLFSLVQLLCINTCRINLQSIFLDDIATGGEKGIFGDKINLIDDFGGPSQ